MLRHLNRISGNEADSCDYRAVHGLHVYNMESVR